ncbi:hypothetical protein [Labrys neptuniae]
MNDRVPRDASGGDGAGLLRAAIENNIAWCGAVCASHSYHEHLSDAVWANLQASPRFYPNIITRRPKAQDEVADLIAVLRQAGLPDGWGIKDSFADLDLTDAGFDMVIAGQWWATSAALPRVTEVPAWQAVGHVHELEGWEAAWGGNPGKRIFKDGLLEDPRVTFWQLPRDGEIAAGFIAFRSEEAIGLSNWFSRLDRSLLALGTAEQVRDPALQRPVVLWDDEAGQELAEAGFVAAGPMRVWLQRSAEQG